MQNVMSKKSDRTYKLTGKYPAERGGDFGFADSTYNIYNINYRPLLVSEIKSNTRMDQSS